MAIVTDEHIDHWREHGYVIIEDVLSAAELRDVHSNIAEYLPSWEEYARAPRRYRSLLGADGWPKAEFPFVGDALNRVTTHPELLGFARQVLGTSDLALSHARLRGKYAGGGNYDQNLHVDYSNNTLAYPKGSEIVDLPFITYYTDVNMDLGPTYVLSQKESRGYLPAAGRFLSRDTYAEAYKKEVPALVRAGATLIYSMRTFHRGSAMRTWEGARFSHHMSYRIGSCRWAGQVSFQYAGGRAEMNHFLEHATTDQRELIGFPPVGDPYWDEETLAGVAARYPGMDMSPYRDGARR